MNSTFVGYVAAVAGSTISVLLARSVSSGISIIGGRSYKIGQVGSFVRIPLGYQNLYGIISDVGANAAPTNDAGVGPDYDRWMTVQLVGEIVEASFERGISQYPNTDDEVHLVTEDDLAAIYGSEIEGHIAIGHLANAESIPVRLDLDKLITRHSAIIGSTGSGKSTSVSSILRSIATGTDGGLPSARILLLDIHGEYGSALADSAKVFRIRPTDGEQKLAIPYWALPPSEIIEFLMGKIDDRALTAILDKIFAAKQAYALSKQVQGIDVNSMTVDSPLPYSLRQLWFDLIDPEVRTYADKERTERAIVEEGNAENLVAPKYLLHSPNNSVPYQNNSNVLGIRRQLDKMRSILLDRQFEFLFEPGEWRPELNGTVEEDLDKLIEGWIGHDNPITVLDLSGIPSTVLIPLVGSILSILYDALFWGRDRPEGGRNRPQLVVMEEAHRYLGKDSNNSARDMVQRIVKEGRKFGIGAMIISQRPSEVDETILSQCGTFLSLRLTNSSDRSKIQSALPDNLAGVADSLPILRTGESIIVGEAARLPVRCRISLPRKEHRPNSEDPKVSESWQKPRSEENYAELLAAWRSQNPQWKPPED